MNPLSRLDEAMLRVAEAIHDAEPKPPGPTDQPVEFMKGPIREHYMRMAHAAINAWLLSGPRNDENVPEDGPDPDEEMVKQFARENADKYALEYPDTGDQDNDTT